MNARLTIDKVDKEHYYYVSLEDFKTNRIIFSFELWYEEDGENMFLTENTLNFKKNDLVVVLVDDVKGVLDEYQLEFLNHNHLPINPHLVWFFINKITEDIILKYDLIEEGISWDTISNFFKENEIYENSYMFPEVLNYPSRLGFDKTYFEENLILGYLFEFIQINNDLENLRSYDDLFTNEGVYAIPNIISYLELTNKFFSWKESFLNLMEEFYHYEMQGYKDHPFLLEELEKLINEKHDNNSDTLTFLTGELRLIRSVL